MHDHRSPAPGVGDLLHVGQGAWSRRPGGRTADTRLCS